MNRYNDTILGYITYLDKKINIIYRPSLKDSICISEWRSGKYRNLVIGDIFKNNINNKDLEPIIYHELYHLYFKSTNEYEADKFACKIVGFNRFEESINKYCRKYLCDLLNYRSSKNIYNSYCIYRLNAVKDIVQSSQDIEIYKTYNLELI